MSDTIVVAIITFLSAIIPVSIKEYFDYRKELKTSKYKDEIVPKKQAIIDFINATNECVCINGTLGLEELSNFQKTANRLLFYFPDIDIGDLKVLKSTLYNNDLSDKDEELRPIIIRLSKSLAEKQ